jgi:hypothetical protein
MILFFSLVFIIFILGLFAGISFFLGPVLFNFRVL